MGRNVTQRLVPFPSLRVDDTQAGVQRAPLQRLLARVQWEAELQLLQSLGMCPPKEGVPFPPHKAEWPGVESAWKATL